MPAQQPRQKRFHNKTRTGCQSCRIRRVKCDERFPVCKACSNRRLTCHYSLRWREPGTDVQSVKDEDDNGYIGRQQVISSTKAALSDQMLPSEWGLMQGLRYYATVLPLIYATPPDHSHYAVHNLALQLLQNDRVPGFLMAMLRHQICNLYAAHGVPAIRPGALPGMVCLWRRLFEYMNEALQAINNSLMQDNQSMPVLARIMEVMSVEVAIMDAPWRKHLRGFLSAVRHYGGVDAVLDNPRAPYRGLQFGLVHGAIGNTVSPVYDQVSAINDWSDADVIRVYTHLYFRGFTCPSRIFLAIHHTTQLRVAAAAVDSATSLPDDLLFTAASIAREIRNFSASQWSETYQMPPQPLIALFGRVYQAAAGLYMLLSLPQPLARLFSGTSNAECDEAARRRQRTILFQAINEARGPLANLQCGTWPLAVLGVAYHDGTPEEHAAIIRLLRESHRSTTNADCGAGTLIRDLPEFWASGKTGWEDCFYKPSHALT